MDRRRFKEPTEYSRLPQEYQEVEYLEGTGTQYINLPVVRNSNAQEEAVTIKFNWNGYIGTSIDDEIVVCGYGSYPNFYIMLGVVGNRPEWGTLRPSGLATNFGIAPATADKTEEITYRHKNSVYTIDGYSKQLSSGTFNPNLVDYFTLFNRRNSTSINTKYNFRGKIYSVIRKIDDTIIQNIVPAIRISDGKPGMYDLVNNQFYTNQGTGEFIIGPEVKPDCDLPGELGPDNPSKAKFIGYKKVGDTETDNWKLVNRLWDYKEGYYNTNTGEFIKYVEDGLVFHLDANSTLNFDNVGNPLQNYGVIKENDYLLFEPGTYIDAFDCFNTNKFDGTICAVFKEKYGGWGGYFVNVLSTINGFSLQVSEKTHPLLGRSILYSTGYSEHYNFTDTSLGIVNAYVMDDFALINGSVCEKIKPYGNSYTANSIILGSIPTVMNCSFLLWNLLVYNRKLSVEEMLNNQKVDNIRFNLGL